jgi:hypothetical protein
MQDLLEIRVGWPRREPWRTCWILIYAYPQRCLDIQEHGLFPPWPISGRKNTSDLFYTSRLRLGFLRFDEWLLDEGTGFQEGACDKCGRAEETQLPGSEGIYDAEVLSDFTYGRPHRVLFNSQANGLLTSGTGTTCGSEPL